VAEANLKAEANLEAESKLEAEAKLEAEKKEKNLMMMMVIEEEDLEEEEGKSFINSNSETIWIEKTTLMMIQSLLTIIMLKEAILEDSA